MIHKASLVPHEFQGQKKVMNKPELVIVGTVNVDLIMGPQEPWPTPGTEVILPNADLREGGGAGNTALALHALDCNQRMIVNVGKDLFGDWLRERYGALSRDWIVDPVDTALTVGITHPDGERTFLSTPGHVAVFRPEDVITKLAQLDLEGVVVLFVGTSLMPTLRPALGDIFQGVREGGGIVALDTAWPTEGWTDEMRNTVLDWLPHVSIFLLNEAETRGLMPSQDDGETDYQSVLSRMPEDALFVTKLGPKGARADRLGETPQFAAPEPAPVVDTIGAGDSFNAGFLLAYARGQSISDCLSVGTRTATAAISSSPRHYPSANEVGLVSRKVTAATGGELVS